MSRKSSIFWDSCSQENMSLKLKLTPSKRKKKLRESIHSWKSSILSLQRRYRKIRKQRKKTKRKALQKGLKVQQNFLRKEPKNRQSLYKSRDWEVQVCLKMKNLSKKNLYLEVNLMQLARNLPEIESIYFLNIVSRCCSPRDKNKVRCSSRWKMKKAVLRPRLWAR